MHSTIMLTVIWLLFLLRLGVFAHQLESDDSKSVMDTYSYSTPLDDQESVSVSSDFQDVMTETVSSSSPMSTIETSEGDDLVPDLLNSYREFETGLIAACTRLTEGDVKLLRDFLETENGSNELAAFLLNVVYAFLARRKYASVSIENEYLSKTDEKYHLETEYFIPIEATEGASLDEEYFSPANEPEPQPEISIDQQTGPSVTRRISDLEDPDCLHDKYPVRIGSIRGIPGEHFPDYEDIPITSFSCADKYAPGFYADLETGCQVFHVCWPHRMESFLCPIGTIFNQAILACDYWYSTNCSLSPLYFESYPLEPQHFPVETPSTMHDLSESGVYVLSTTEAPLVAESSTTVPPIEPASVSSFDENVIENIWSLMKFKPFTSKVVNYPGSYPSESADHILKKPKFKLNKESIPSEIMQTIHKVAEDLARETERYVTRVIADKVKTKGSLKTVSVAKERPLTAESSYHPFDYSSSSQPGQPLVGVNPKFVIKPVHAKFTLKPRFKPSIKSVKHPKYDHQNLVKILLDG